MIQLHKIALLVALISLTAAREYANFQQLVNSDGTPANFQLYWTVEGELIQIKITAQTSGWIGFGFSPDGTMVNSDVVIGWVSANGDHFFDDRYAVQYSEPIIDVNMVPPGENNCQLLSISYQNGWTTIEYSRALDTGDQWDVAVTSGEMLVVWAMGYEGDNPDNGRISRHQYRAVNTVTFIESSGPTLPNVLEPTCEGASNRRTYSGDSTGVQSIRLETLAGELRLTGTKTLKNLGVHVLESAYDTTDLQTVQTNFFSPSPDAWVVTSQRGTASLSSPSSTTGPVSGTQGTLNTTISASECVAASMHLTVPSVPPAQISGYTYQGNVVLNELTVGNNFQVKTNAGQISGVVYTQDGTISIQTEWAEVSMQVERHLSFEGTAIMRVIFVGYAGSYDVSVSSDTYKFTVGGDTVTPVSGATTYESGYVGFEGQVASVNITADCDLEVVFIHDAGTLTADLQIPSFNVPKRRTSYICTTVDLPSDQDYHIIRIDPIDKQTSGRSVLHHMVLFVCETQLAYTEPWDCSIMDPQCISMLYVWAIGGSNFYLPEEAGFLIGPNGDKYGILQLHYDNPDGLEDVWDNSGFRIYYTTDLRQYNAGIVEVGVMEIAIPPGETAYQVGELGNGCPAECTTLNIPDESGVVVFASMLHAHLAGRQIWTEHYRPAENGSLVRIEDLNNNPYYDFNVQSYDVFNPPKVLMPGDALVTYCVYNTEDRTEVTTYGLSSYKEMCYNFIAYYPESAWFMCVGYPSSPGATTGIAYCDDQVIVNSWGSVEEEQ